MNKYMKRFLAVLLTAVMMLTILPVNVFASLLDNDSAYNREILDTLKEIAGSEDEARQYYAALQEYGLLDADGNIIESWSIEYHGEEISLEGLREIFAGDYDPEDIVWIDDTPFTLEEVKTMVEIEDYVQYIKETYYSQKEWTEEQTASYKSMLRQLVTTGIDIDRVASPVIGPSGMNHAARINVEKIEEDTEERLVSFAATLSGAYAGQTVSFQWSAISGSRPVSAETRSKTEEMTAGADGTASVIFTVKYDAISSDSGNNNANPAPVRTPENDTTVFYVSCKNPVNALFSNDKENMYLRVDTAGTVGSGKFPEWGYIGQHFTHFYLNSVTNRLDDLNIQTLYAIRWGITSHVTTYIDGSVFDSSFSAAVGDYNHAGGDVAQRDGNGQLVQWTDQDLIYREWSTQNMSFCTKKEYDLSKYPTLKKQSEPIVFSKHTFTDTNGVSHSVYPDYEFADLIAPEIKSWTCLPGTYCSGDVIPIVVTFSEPVQAHPQLTVNGVTITSAESGPCNVMTFPYEVLEPDRNDGKLVISHIEAKDIVGNGLSSGFGSGNGLYEVPGVTLVPLNKQHVFSAVSAEIDQSDSRNPMLVLTVGISDNEQLTQWMGSDFDRDAQGNYTSKSIKTTVDGTNFTYLRAVSETVTGNVLTASIPLPVNTGPAAKEYTAELYLENQLVFGMAAKAALPPIMLVTSDDIEAYVSVKQIDGVTDYEYADETGQIYLQDYPRIRAFYKLKGDNFTYRDVMWSSSDTTVANIDQEGRITPTGKTGDVKFRLTALNGDLSEQAAYAETQTLSFGTGLTPFLSIFTGNIRSFSGEDVSIYWCSNLCDKNGEAVTTFTVNVTRGDDTLEPITVSGNASEPAASVTINGEDLLYQYGPDAVNVLNVTISATYNGKTFRAHTSITLKPCPANVKLNGLDNYCILDTAGPVKIDWQITECDQYSSDDPEKLFRLYITKGSTPVCDISDPTGELEEEPGNDGRFLGSYTIPDISVTADSSDKLSYRDIYTVTIQAKNGNDSTWSYDSFILYVYDADALKIWVDGSAPNDGTFTMTNIPTISQMTQKDILALKRDISLHNVISANYGEYAWSELADQLSWNSENDNVATLNYQQGAISENIRDYSYTSYRPTTDFTISGLSDGSTKIEATHVYTGMKAGLNVTVNTLKNKLFLFQCYPQVTTTLAYTNGAGVKKTVESDETGAAAIYEESGIKSDVFCSSTDKNGNVYCGTFYNESLDSGERDSTKLELYPCNNLKLRRAAFAFIFIKKPDGTPYTGKITVRGGVYVNGKYVDEAKFAYNGGAVDQKGYEDCTLDLKSDGKLEIVMDQTQWGLPGDQIGTDDKVSFSFLIKQGSNGTDYYPLLANVDASVNEDSYISSGDAILNFRKNESGEKQPYVLAQTATLGYTKDGQTYSQAPVSVMDYTGCVGASDDWTTCDLTTAVLWWGQSADRTNKSLKMYTNKGNNTFGVDDNTANQKNDGFPFFDECITTFTVTINDNNTKLVSRREIQTPHLSYLVSGNPVRDEELSFRVCNMIGAGKVEDSDTLLGSLQQMGSAFDNKASLNLSTGDEIVKGLLYLSMLSYTPVGGDLQLTVTPTSDPTKFLGFASLNHDTKIAAQASGAVGHGSGSASGSLPLVTNIFKINGRDMSAHMARTNKNAVDASKDTRDLVMMTQTTNSMTNQTWDTYKKQYLKETNQSSSTGGLSLGVEKDKGNGKLGVSGSVGGYVEFLIYYDYGTHKWKSKVIDGGFSFGFTVNYSRSFNTLVGGVVPVTYGYQFGGTVTLNLDSITAAYLPADAENQYMTELADERLWQLRLDLFAKFFGGLGVDMGSVKLKLVAFIKVSFSFTFEALIRDYLKDHKGALVLADGKADSDGPKLYGGDFRLNVQVGAEFVVKFLCITYSKVLAQATFTLGGSVGDWKRLNELWKESQANLKWSIEHMLRNGSAQINTINGQRVISLDLAPTIENRDYLKTGSKRVWGATKRSGLFRAKAVVDGVSNLETNTYPYAAPETTRDGAVLVYLSDMGSSNVADTRASFAVKRENEYEQGGAISDAGFGDEHLTVDGTGDFAVAAWTRQTVDLKKEAGSVVQDEDQMILLENTDVYAAVYTNGEWSTVCLDEHSGASIAPTVAVNGNAEDGFIAVVAWRSVAVADTSNITDFDKEDTILYKTYNSETGIWSETKSLYNGTSGNVKGLVSAMMTNGTTAVAYTLDNDSDDKTYNDRDIVYAVIGPDGEVIRNVRATSDNELADKPQIAAVTLPVDGEEEERFVLAWYTASYEAADEQNAAVLTDDAQNDEDQTEGDAGNPDICLLDFDDQGITSKLLPHSLSQMAAETRATISPNYRFAKNAGSINNLSIVWSQRAAEQPKDCVVEKDVLKAVRFFSYGENNDMYDITCDLDVAEMPDNSTIEHFAAYSDGENVAAVLLGSTCIDGELEERTEETVGGDPVIYTIPKMTSVMYTAVDTYEDKIEVPLTLADFDTIRLGAGTQIQINVENRGAHLVNSISVNLDGKDTKISDLNLLPGDTQQIWVDYTVPETAVENPQYTVTAEFETGEEKTASGTIYLDYPDLEITKVRIVREENGERDIQVQLNNRLDSKLENSGRTVKISFWSDPTYETPLESIDPVTVRTNTDLKMIDEGGYSCQVTFDVASFIKNEDGSVGEIPSSGVPVYVKAEVLKGDDVVNEPLLADNTQAVTCENLQIRTGTEIAVSTNLECGSNDSSVNVSLKNMKMAPVSNGNLIVSLLDEDGNILEQKQSYSGKDSSLISLDAEEKYEETVSFDRVGASVQAEFCIINNDVDNTELSIFSVNQLPGLSLDSFHEQADGTFAAEVDANGLTALTVRAATKSSLSAIGLKVNGVEQPAGSTIVSKTASLLPGQDNTVEITVTADNCSVRTYILTVHNGSSPDPETNTCKWCGGTHTGFPGKLIGFFHSILWFFAHLFGKR